MGICGYAHGGGCCWELDWGLGSFVRGGTVGKVGTGHEDVFWMG